MSAPNLQSAPPIASDLACLAALFSYHGKLADPGQIRRWLEHSRPVDAAGLVRLGRGAGLKARSLTSRLERSGSMPLPGITAIADDRFLVLTRIDESRALVPCPAEERPSLMVRADFEAAWTGRLILMTPRAGVGDLMKRFDLEETLCSSLSDAGRAR